MLTKPLHLDVHEQIECAQTLASRFYTDPAILEFEKARITFQTRLPQKTGVLWMHNQDQRLTVFFR